MKTRLTHLALMALIALLVMAGCTTPATQLPATQAPSTQPPPTQALPTKMPVSQVTPPSKLNTEIVLNMIESLNKGDVEGSLAYFADHATGYIVGLPPTGMEVYRGKDQIRSLWEDSVANHFEWEVDVKNAIGNEVMIHAKTWHDFTRQIGVAPLEWTDIYEVVDGKILTYSSTITADSLAKLRPALAEAMPSEPPATPSNDPPVSAMTVTITDGTCTTDHPLTLQAGEVAVTLNIQDEDNSVYALYLFNLDAGKDLLDLMASTAGLPPDWVNILLGENLGPGKSDTYTFTLEEGPLYLVCWSQPPAIAIGNDGPIPVSP